MTQDANQTEQTADQEQSPCSCGAVAADMELVARARAGDVIGDGTKQIAALLRELDKRPTAIVIDVDCQIDDAFSASRKVDSIQGGVVYGIVISQGKSTWEFESVVRTR